MHEIEAARIMIKRLCKSSCSNIILADRGYNSLDLLATITDSNCDYLFRAHAKFLALHVFLGDLYFTEEMEKY